MMWIKITAIADENDWFFISDQICPADVSRLQQPGFWAYLQCCKCCIDCFVIQLLSEPDKLKSVACLKQDWCRVSSAFSGHAWPNLRQIQNHFKFNASVKWEIHVHA